MEYIESTGTQYIDTGYYLSSNNLKFKTKFYINNYPSSEQNIISNQDNLTGRFVVGIYNPNSLFAYSRNSQGKDTNVLYNPLNEKTINEVEVIYDYDNHIKTLINNGVFNSVTMNATIANSNRTIVLFKAAPANGYYFSGRTYYLQLYVDNILIRYFIPCYRKSDNEIGLYDIVNGVFYTNQGTGTFEKGPDI